MKSVFILIGLLFSAHLSAEVYKCTDAKGNKIYRSAPCSEGQKNITLNVKTGNATDLDAKAQSEAASQQEQEAQVNQQRLEEEQKQRQLEQLKQSAIDESAKNQFLVKSNPAKFSPFAIPPYKYDDLPPFVKAFQSRLPDVERLRRAAAEKSLATGECGRVESTELSEKSSKSNLVVLVDCSSAKKYYISEKDIAP